MHEGARNAFEIADPGGAPEAAVRRLADALHAMLHVAVSLVEAGRAIELAGIDAMTGRLCASVLDLGPERSILFRDDMVRLGDEIDRLMVTMTNRLRDASANTMK